MTNTSTHEITLPATDWERFFTRAKVRVNELEGCKSDHSKAVRIGKFLGPMIGRRVPIQHAGRTGTAELRVVEGRGRERRYGFIIRWDDAAADASVQRGAATASDVDNMAKKVDPTKPAPGSPGKSVMAPPVANKGTSKAPTVSPIRKVTPAKGTTVNGSTGNLEKW